MYIRRYLKTQYEKVQEQVDEIETELLEHGNKQSSQAMWVKTFLEF